MQYFEAPGPIATRLPSIFLAGGIGNCPDWQAAAVEMLGSEPVAVLNPRRPSFPVPWTREQSEVQIGWEYHALAACDVILFWFPGTASAQPIALFELGSHLWSGKRLAIGRDSAYLRADDIDIQVRLARPDLLVHETLSETVTAALALLKREGLR